MSVVVVGFCLTEFTITAFFEEVTFFDNPAHNAFMTNVSILRFCFSLFRVKLIFKTINQSIHIFPEKVVFSITAGDGLYCSYL